MVSGARGGDVFCLSFFFSSFVVLLNGGGEEGLGGSGCLASRSRDGICFATAALG